MSRTKQKGQPQLRMLRDGDRVNVQFLDAHVCGDDCVIQIRKGIDTIIRSVPEAQVEIDLSNVEFVSSAALGELMSARKKLTHARGHLRLMQPRDEVKEILAVTKLDSVFAIA
jgi:anti-sigma B factor antagonist